MSSAPPQPVREHAGEYLHQVSCDYLQGTLQVGPIDSRSREGHGPLEPHLSFYPFPLAPSSRLYVVRPSVSMAERSQEAPVGAEE